MVLVPLVDQIPIVDVDVQISSLVDAVAVGRVPTPLMVHGNLANPK